MSFFSYEETELMAEAIPLQKIAQDFGTPCYVYSKASIERNWHSFSSALQTHAHRICYAVKANSNLTVLRFLASLGASFDIVSIGELERVLLARGEPSKIIFSGVGKQEHEIRRALELGIFCFNVESQEELLLINHVAQDLSCRARISLRINPDVDAKTHPYISTGMKENKFGLTPEAAKNLCLQLQEMPGIKLIGIACHIGSQLTEVSPYIEAIHKMLEFADFLRSIGMVIHHIDLGGGFGVNYGDQRVPTPFEYMDAILGVMRKEPYEIIIEPGRAIVGNAGVLLTKILFLKHSNDKNFAIVDGSMNDLIRPALYGAWHSIDPVNLRMDEPTACYDIVGPVCETADFLGKHRELALRKGDILAVRSVGAYGFVMSSQYNTKPRPPEIWVDGDVATVIRRRETVMDLVANEVGIHVDKI